MHLNSLARDARAILSRSCEVCSVETSARRRFCGPKCAAAARLQARIADRKCEWCGVATHRRFCTTACKNRAYYVAGGICSVEGCDLVVGMSPIKLCRVHRGKPYPTVPCSNCGAAVRKRAGVDITLCMGCWNERNRGSRDAAVSRARRKRERAVARARKCALGSFGVSVWVSGACASCGVLFVRRGAASPFCSKRCSSRERRAVRRALEAGAKITPGRRYAVYERDGWVCQICGDPVNRAAQVPELDAPVIDHVVALARGGEHGLTNWQTAHFYCNSVKRDLSMDHFAAA